MGWIRHLVVVLAVCVVGLDSSVASAQAIVDPKGSVNATLNSDFGMADTIVETGGSEFPNVFVYSQITTLGVEYVPIKKLAVRVGLPLVGTLYSKNKSGMDFDPHGPNDDGNWHFTLQDMRADVRYMVLPPPFALAFNAGLTVPVADYPVQGSAAAGRHLVQGRFGLATSISPTFAPKAFLNFSYEFTLSQKFDETPDTAKFGQSRSEVGMQVGYAVRPKLNLFLLAQARVQHDGIDFVDFAMLTPDQQTFHDPILREAALLLGLGATYQLTDKLYVAGSYAQFIAGRNTLTFNVVSLSVGWNIR